MAIVGQPLIEPEEGWQRIDNTHPLIFYSGTWTTTENAEHYMGTRHLSNQAAKRVDFSFTGSRIRLIVGTSSNRTQASVISVDGKEYTFSTRFTASSGILARYLAVEITDLDFAKHRVFIYDTSTSYLDIDAIDIDDTGYFFEGAPQLLTPDEGWVRYDATDYTARRGAWTLLNATAVRPFTGGSVHYTAANKNYLVFKFVGSKFRLIAEFNSTYDSNVEIRIDGDSVENFSINYGKSYQSYSLAYEKRGLDFTEHTVMIIKTSGAHMLIDSIDLEEAGTMLPMPTQVIGDVLKTPQEGWQRLDSSHPYLFYDGIGWSTNSNASYYNGSRRVSANNNLTDALRFVFKGTSLRLLTTYYLTYSNSLQITIDGKTEVFSQSFNTAYTVIAYEKLDLADTEHVVEVKRVINGTTNPDFTIEAIDINDGGYIKSIQGSQLVNPDEGWRRYDDTDPALTYVGTWLTSSVTIDTKYGGTFRYATAIASTVSFTFYGTKLRIISYREASATTTDALIMVDGQEYHYSNVGNVTGFINVFELVGLSLGEHTVTLRTNIAGKQVNIDAIDIDEMGYMVSSVSYPQTGGSLKSTVAEMKVGDFIRCGYRATGANTAGTFYRLGSEDIETELPILPSNVPYGFFYFVKVDEGILVADRPIQYGVTWLTLNAAKLVHGTLLKANDNPEMVSNTNPYGKASASSVYSATYDAYFAFNGKDEAYGWITASGVKAAWLEYEFHKPTLIQKYSLRAPANYPTIMPRNWTFEAWDGTSWVVLDTDSYTGWHTLEEREFVFPNMTKYKRYRINILTNDGHANYTGINELRLYKDPVRATVRLFNGGRCFVDADGYPTNANTGNGIYPTDNEWDKHLGKGEFVNPSTSNGEDVWRFSSVDAEWAQDSVQPGFTSLGTGFDASGNGRTVRGMGGYKDSYWSIAGTYLSPSKIGYRPIVEYYHD
ncbi:hypothetical protein [Paenibacillus sp. NPDC057967]|uniref:hypothetical protein n=1 Tax=Paenibacillus sp. NPDC057967 TaxID=3346293 RepID=UPI0036DCBF06